MRVTPPIVRRVHVYELVNVTRRQSLLAITSEDEGVVRLRLRVDPPRDAEHWDAARDEVSVVLLGANLSPKAAKEFAARYRDHRRSPPWACLLWSP